MFLINKFKNLNYNFLYSTMQKSFITGLRLKNNLTNQLEQFQPRNGRNVKWYTCGPTVYSHSHLGHARNYICNDMIRRVLKDYFGYNVQYCMNITDVDDKIINKSNEEGIQYFEFAKKWETDFFDDMRLLGVDDPDYLTRVTQFIPQIVTFIEKIISNGYAYASNGSVYFNIKEYQTKFKYGKLKRMKDAETEEEESNEKGEKKNKEDFALWKAVKPNEPSWDSPWGKGRPGWHIQCSAMAGSILGQQMDIHSGGIDLIFPHHENELAQSQAHNNEPDWVKYFIHVGHLHIKGLKMSKSLKNFITIKELLKIVPARQIKLFFVIHRYDVILSYDPDTSLKQAEEKDRRYKNFFGTLQAAIRVQKINGPQKMTKEDAEFDQFLQITEHRIYQAFCDNINTPGVINEVDQAIKKTNIYLTLKTRKITSLQKAYRVISKPFKAVGLNYEATESTSNEAAILTSITKFRDEIRENSKSDFLKILQICDKFRDYDMVDLNVRIQDKKVGDPSTWKYESKQILIKEREKKIEDKLKKERQAKQKEEQKLKKMRTNPKDLWVEDERYSEFDERGVPTHERKKQKVKENDKETQVLVSKPINDKLKKKLEKEWNEQNQLYNKWLQLQKNKN